MFTCILQRFLRAAPVPALLGIIRMFNFRKQLRRDPEASSAAARESIRRKSRSQQRMRISPGHPGTLVSQSSTKRGESSESHWGMMRKRR